MNALRRCIASLIAASLVAFHLPAIAADIRIVVAAEGPEATANVSKVAARAPHLLEFDGKGALKSSTPNPAAKAPGGAASVVAGWLRDRKIGVFVAGSFGTNLERALDEAKIRRVVASGPADVAVRKEVAR